MITAEKVIESVSKHSGISAEVFLSSSRKREHADARLCAMYLCYLLLPDHTERSLAKVFSRERKTISYARERIPGLMYLPEISGLVEAVKSELAPGKTLSEEQAALDRIKFKISRLNKEVKTIKSKNKAA